MKNKLILATTFVFSLVLALSIVSAAGVSAPYWDTKGNENPLYLPIGKTQNVNFELQNMVGGEEITFQVSLVSENNVATLTNQNTEYTLAAGERKNVEIKVQSPPGAKIGDKYKVTFTAKQVNQNTPGQFTLGSAFETSFDVVISDKSITGNASLSPLSGNTTIYIIIALVLIIIAFIWFKRRK